MSADAGFCTEHEHILGEVERDIEGLRDNVIGPPSNNCVIADAV